MLQSYLPHLVVVSTAPSAVATSSSSPSTTTTLEKHSGSITGCTNPASSHQTSHLLEPLCRDTLWLVTKAVDLSACLCQHKPIPRTDRTFGEGAGGEGHTFRWQSYCPQLRWTPITHLLCKRNWALWICSWVPVIVMIRSFDPGNPSSMTIWALDCRRISCIRAPPFPIIAPASYNMDTIISGVDSYKMPNIWGWWLNFTKNLEEKTYVLWNGDLGWG